MNNHHDKIFDLIYSDKDEVMWKKILIDLVSADDMDPWNIDVGLLSNKYIEKVRNLQKHDFRISGKVVLTAAILLKIKSDRLIGEDFEELDRLLATIDEAEEDLGVHEDLDIPKFNEDVPHLIPRTPQPRKRKVSIYDLVKALQQALDVKKRRVWNSAPPTDVEIPTKPREITEIIKEVYGKIRAYFLKSQDPLRFSKLLTSQKKEDKISTFIPLLHLSQQDKIELEQQKSFGDINIKMKTHSEQNESKDLNISKEH